MRAFACRIAIALFTIGFCPALPGRELRSAIELNSVIFGDETNTVPFCLEATATETIPPDTRKSRSFMDETGAVQLYLMCDYISDLYLAKDKDVNIFLGLNIMIGKGEK